MKRSIDDWPGVEGGLGAPGHAWPRRCPRPGRTRAARLAACRWAWVAVCLVVLVAPSVGRAEGRSAIDARRWIASPHWRVLAVEYARSTPIPVRRLVVGADRRARVEMSWLFYVVVGHQRVVLVDTGTDVFAARPRGVRARGWRVGWRRRVVESLETIRLRPADVTDILLTHRHWDHVGGTPRFPRARVHMHRGEWRGMSRAIRNQVPAARRRLWRKSPYVPHAGLTMRIAGRHTRFHAVVEVRCRDRTIALVGDGAYLWKNLRDRRPVTVTRHPRQNVREMAALTKRLGVWNVLPGHEPQIFSRYASGDPHVAVICR